MNSPPAPILFPDLDLAVFRTRLLAWYRTHARDLPWRENRDPYRVWISEIMLQQTRVAAVIEHYRKFLRKFPTVEVLASARESEVLAAWSGLGYYRRARMLHAAAKMVLRDYGGVLPPTAARLQDLPGIGRYTAAAIASIAFGEPVAVLDGNVERVLRRISGLPLSGEQLWGAATHLLDPVHPGDFNQAMMEFGATVCTPQAPTCLTCPILELCATRGEMAEATNKKQQKKREISYSLTSRRIKPLKLEVFLVQRPRKASLMAGMWELPEISELDASSDLAFTMRHSITVTDYKVRVWSTPIAAHPKGRWVSAAKLREMALTGLARKILRKAEIL